MYDTIEEARQKLEGCVVIFDNTPVRIVKIGGKDSKILLYYTPLPLIQGAFDDSSLKKEYMESPLWDFRNLGSRLGYVAMTNPVTGYSDTVFVSRGPFRHSIQGLAERTVFIKHHGLHQYSWPCSWINIIMSPSIINTMQSKYPPSPEVFQSLVKEGKVSAGPISRKLALFFDRVNPPNLVYRNEKVGYTEDGLTFRLASHKSYLKEELQDCEGLKIA